MANNAKSETINLEKLFAVLITGKGVRDLTCKDILCISEKTTQQKNGQRYIKRQLTGKGNTNSL